MYEIEFYEDEHGREPCLDWMDNDLSSGKRAALLAALRHVLGRQGLNTCKTEYGKNLGGGLAEFRLRHSEQVILGKFVEEEDRFEESEDESPSGEKVLLRVFFHAHGRKMILLLGGYDKGKNPKPRRQQSEIERARKRLVAWKQQQRRK